MRTERVGSIIDVPNNFLANRLHCKRDGMTFDLLVKCPEACSKLVVFPSTRTSVGVVAKLSLADTILHESE